MESKEEILRDIIKLRETGTIRDFELIKLRVTGLPSDISTELLQELEGAAFNRGYDLDFQQPVVESSKGGEVPLQGDGPFAVESLNELVLESEAKQTVGLYDVSKLFVAQAVELLKTHKRFYVFKIGPSPQVSKSLFVHDQIPNPEIIFKSFRSFQDSISLKDFIEGIERGDAEVLAETHLCLLLVSDFSTMASRLLDNRGEILKKFSTFKYYELIFEEDRAKPYEYEGERFFDCFESDATISLSNGALDKSEESLVKSFFPPSPSQIQYKILKGGFSGAKVLEVCQDFSVVKPCRYIVKIGKRNDRKIQDEERAVKKHVSSYSAKYQTEIKSNATYEAIKYQFASSDSKRDSTSFKDFFKHSRSAQIRPVVVDLFTKDLFKEWERLQFRTKQPIKISELYNEYVDWLKIEKVVREISFEKSDDDIQKFKKCLDITLKYNVSKTSHGDLHSENVIIDGASPLLIDFGMTGVRHSLIDYATLETSIRLKLIPPYFPTNVICKHDVDDNFLFRLDVPDASIGAKVSNPTLVKAYEVISTIRKLALERSKAIAIDFDSNDDIQKHYLVSLFCISLRNLKYEDLNQKYALALCRYLADYLLRVLP